MALLPDRQVISTELGFFMNQVAERGGIATLLTGASGVALDISNAVCQYAANPSGLAPLGLLLVDMVNLDLTKQIPNFYKDQMQIGSKVALMTRGFVTTNLITGTPAAGGPAYLGASGYLTPTRSSNGGTAATPIVGRFWTSLDENGYARVEVNIPMTQN